MGNKKCSKPPTRYILSNIDDYGLMESMVVLCGQDTHPHNHMYILESYIYIYIMWNYTENCLGMEMDVGFNM